MAAGYEMMFAALVSLLNSTAEYYTRKSRIFKNKFLSRFLFHEVINYCVLKMCLQSRINWLTLQCENTKHGFMNTIKWVMCDEAR